MLAKTVAFGMLLFFGGALGVIDQDLSKKHLNEILSSVAANTSRPMPSPQPGVPKVFLQVMKVKERIVVDGKNHPKSATAEVDGAMYRVGNSGRLQRLFWTRLHVAPKPGSAAMKKLAEQLRASKVLNEVDPTIQLPEWVVKLAKKLHLDQFWPRLTVSIVLGFILTGVIFLLGKFFIFLVRLTTGYNIAGEGIDEDGQNEDLIRRERLRNEESKPLVA